MDPEKALKVHAAYLLIADLQFGGSRTLQYIAIDRSQVAETCVGKIHGRQNPNEQKSAYR